MHAHCIEWKLAMGNRAKAYDLVGNKGYTACSCSYFQACVALYVLESSKGVAGGVHRTPIVGPLHRRVSMSISILYKFNEPGPKEGEEWSTCLHWSVYPFPSTHSHTAFTSCSVALPRALLGGHFFFIYITTGTGVVPGILWEQRTSVYL